MSKTKVQDTTQWVPKVGDIVESKHTYRLAKIVEVSTRFGWLDVVYLDDDTKRRRYTMLDPTMMSIRPLTKEEKADLFLKFENAGLTDYWRD